MKIILFSLTLFILISFETKAQSCKTPCPYYTDFVRMAQADTVKNTQTKLNYYRAAIVAAKDCHCPELEQNANKQIDTLFIIIEEEKRRAEALSQTILEQQNEIKVALKEAKAANRKNLKIINAMDFYDKKFALAFNGEKYGFIDKEGNSKLDFKYDKGEPFDKEIGFAEMEIKSRRSNTTTKYLLDTIGNTYELFNMSEEYMIGLRNKVAKNKKSKVKGVDPDLKLIKEELYSNFDGYGAIALNFQKIKKNSALTILKCLEEGDDTKDRVEVIIWRGKDLEVFPEVISEFTNLKYIYMYWTSVDSIPDGIGRLKKLKKIKLPHGVKTLPSSFYNLENLEDLDFSGTEIKTFPKAIENLKKLKYLNFPSTFETLPLCFYNLENLEHLDLYVAKIKVIPKAIGNLKNLKSLELPSNLKSLSSSVYGLEKLEYLDIYNAGSEDILEAIGNLKKLKELRIEVQMEILPESIGNLINLEELNLVRSGLTKLPESIGNLKRLKNLYLPFSLEILPESIGNLINLEELNLIRSRIIKLPESISKMESLKRLLLPSSLETFPESIGEMENLERLYFFTKLDTFPESIGNLLNLKKLDINNSQNFKKALNISNLKKLEHFYLVLYTDENYAANVSRLKELKRKLPNCFLHIRNEKGEKMEMFNPF